MLRKSPPTQTAPTRIARNIDRGWPHQVALPADQVTGANYDLVHGFWPALAQRQVFAHDGDMYVISINRGHFKGRPTEVCQVMVPQRAEPVMSIITKKIKTRFVGTNNNGVEIGDVYELIKHPSINPAAMMVSRSTDDHPFFTVAFMGIK